MSKHGIIPEPVRQERVLEVGVTNKAENPRRSGRGTGDGGKRGLTLSISKKINQEPVPFAWKNASRSEGSSEVEIFTRDRRESTSGAFGKSHRRPVSCVEEGGMP